MIDIRILKDEKELYDVGKLRFEVYVNEMKRNQKYADELKKIIIEPEDRLPSTRILVAYEETELIGTSRVNIYYPKDDKSGLECYGIPKQISDSLTISEGTKFMIKKSYRGKQHEFGIQMMVFAYQMLLKEKVDIDLLNANDYLIHYYQGKGYRRYGDGYHHKELKQFVYPMALLINDYEYLKGINSPFYEKSIESIYAVDRSKLEIAKKIFGRGDL